MSEETYVEDFDDTSIFENKAGLAEVITGRKYWENIPLLSCPGHAVPGLNTRAV